MKFQQYRRKGLSEIRPYVPGEDVTGISIAEQDRLAGSPKAGDMIARNPKNHADQWLVSEKYFADNLEPVGEPATEGLSYGAAIVALEHGRRVARAGWNGKGMYLWMLPGMKVKAEGCLEPHLKALAEANGGEIECLPSIRMLTADRKVLTGWLTSQSDVFAKDWMILPS